MVIRKALFSPRIETRRIAINGVLALLKNFKISSGIISSTSTQQILSQSSSGLSQVVADVHCGKTISYEALCLELLGVLKRGFTQQVGVRMSLYQGLYDVVVRNPELCPKILQMLYQHALSHGLNNVNNSICPIDVNEMVSVQDGKAEIKVSNIFNTFQDEFQKILSTSIVEVQRKFGNISPQITFHLHFFMFCSVLT